MYSETQEEVYRACLDRVLDKLETLIKPLNTDQSNPQGLPTAMSNNEIGRHAFLFALVCSLKRNAEISATVSNKIYPEHPSVAAVFIEISKLINSQASEHYFLKQTHDPRFFSKNDTTPEPKEMVQHLADKLKMDLGKWYRAHCEQKPINKQYMNILQHRFRDDLSANKGDQDEQQLVASSLRR